MKSSTFTIFMSILLGILTAFNSNVKGAAAQVYPQEDANGDYFLANDDDGFGHLRYEWEVVDSDPDGLNCRYMNRTNKPPGSDIYNYPVAYALPTGEEFYSDGIYSDDRGLPWLWVGTSMTTEICFVRANSSFVLPVRPFQIRR